MNQKLVDFNQSQRTKNIPLLRVGDIVRVHKRIKEGDKERVQVYKGLIISIKGNQSSSPVITIRRESQGVGVEIVFPLYLPTIEKVDLLRHSKVRRSKLYYMRQRSGKAAKMKVLDLTDKEKESQAQDKKQPEKQEKVTKENQTKEQPKDKKGEK